FQRLEVTIPSEQTITPFMARGDLQTRVSTSKPNIVAGQEFSVFVIIDNPFEVPIVLYTVETQIPVEIVDIVGRQRRRAVILEEDPSLNQQPRGIRSAIVRRTWDRWRINWWLKEEPDSRIAQAVAASEIRERRREINIQSNVTVGSISSGEAIGV